LTVCVNAPDDLHPTSTKAHNEKYISYTMMALLGTVCSVDPASTEDTMMEKEKAAWQAFKDRKSDDFEKVVSAKLVGVYAEGRSDLQKNWRHAEMGHESFAISDYKVTSDGSTQLSQPQGEIEGAYDGKDQTGTYNAASVWKKQKGKGEWQAIFHTNIKQAATATQ